MVTLYTTGCPKCRVLETKLGQVGIDYNKVDDIDLMIERGFLEAPILEVDGVTMDFKSAVQWLKMR